MSLLSAVVPVRNKVHFIDRCVGSILASARQAGNTEVILVENGSSDGSERALAILASEDVVLIRSDARTAARARNEGVARSRGDILCFLDADVLVPATYFSSVRRVFEEKWVGAAGCTVDQPENNWIDRTWGRLHARKRLGLNVSINGANLCVRRAAFERVGGFDATLITGEDADLCLRLVESGETLLEAPVMSVLHVDNPVTVREFFAKEAWRGLGAFATARWDRPDKPLILTVVYAALLLTALAVLVAFGASPRGWLAAACTASLVPVMSVAYRWAQAESPVAFLRSVALYHIYFLARGVALLRIVAGRHRAVT